jgi:energy-coupling factor transport system permease protein
MASITSITFGQYYPGDSILHQTDPRVKLSLVLLYTIILFLIKNFLSFLLISLLLGWLILLANLPLRLVLRSIRPLTFILIFTFLIHLFATSGPVVNIGPLAVSIEGIRNGTFVIVRLILLIVGASLLTLTSTPTELTDALESIFRPLSRLGLPTHELAMMMTIALRFIPVLISEADRIVRAQKARGADFETGSLVRRIKNLIPVLIPLFVSVFKKADELAIAMEARGYRGGRHRTRLRELVIKPVDIFILLFMSLVFGGLLWLGRLTLF